MPKWPSKPRSNQQVFVDGQIAERLRNLKRPTNARSAALHRCLIGNVIAIQQNPALIGADVAGDQVEQR